MKVNTLFLISGPSGSGKTTIMRRLMDNEVVSFTTRDPRPGERDGVDYNFISFDHFQDLLASGGLVEHSNYGGNFYGITKHELFGKLEKGHAFAIVDANGKRKLESLYPQYASIFIYATKDDARFHLFARGESDEFIERRLKTYHDELRNRGEYNYVVRNIHGRLDGTTRIVQAIIDAEASK